MDGHYLKRCSRALPETRFRKSNAEIDLQNTADLLLRNAHDRRIKLSTSTIRPERLKQSNKRRKRMDRYVCLICGYVYDPEQGDPDNGVAAGTKWEDVPDDWECPVCGASKDDFEKE
jgi:rubredoxin